MKFPKMKMKMNPIGFFADLMTSKYFLLFMALLSAVNIIGYMSMGYIDAVILFAMVAYLTFVFSKNMTVVLLVSFVIVNLYMHSGMTIEGVSVGGRKDASSLEAGKDIGNVEALTNKDDVTPGDDEIETEEPDVETTEENVVEDDEEGEEVEGFSGKKRTKTIAKKMKPSDKKKPKKKTDEGFKEGIIRKTEKFQNIEAAPTKKHSHIDYGTTLEDAYKNLERMLGEEGLQNLTSDTKKLMEQQSKLFNSMENIAPLLAQAQSMMKGMNMSGKVGGLADSAEEI
jgi:hypothetical protein